MTKGKYAERAKTKRAADGVAAMAIAEQNKLRHRIRQLEHLDVENAQLRLRLDELRQEIEEQRALNEEGASDEVRRLNRVNVDVHREGLEWQKLAETIRHEHRSQLEQIGWVLRTELPHNATYWRLMKAFYSIVITQGDNKWKRMTVEQFKADIMKGSVPRSTDDEETVHEEFVATIERYGLQIDQHERESLA